MFQVVQSPADMFVGVNDAENAHNRLCTFVFMQSTVHVCIYARECSDMCYLSVLDHATGTAFSWSSLPKVMFKLDFKVEVRV